MPNARKMTVHLSVASNVNSSGKVTLNGRAARAAFITLGAALVPMGKQYYLILFRLLLLLSVMCWTEILCVPVV